MGRSELAWMVGLFLATVTFATHSSKAGPFAQRLNAEVARRKSIELEEAYVEKEYDLFVTNELELIRPQDIKLESFAASSGGGGVTRMITSISPSVASNDDMITVSFYSSKPQPNDWVAAYSPPDVDITKTVPVKYAWMDTDKSFNKTHHGSLRFRMTNLREGVKFYYMTNGLKKGAAANVSSQTLTWTNPNEQLRPRVVATGNPDVFSLLWSSASSTKPTLKWRSTKTGAYTTIVPATTDSITKEQLCGYPANDIGWFNTGLIHSAPLQGMLALSGKTIYYKFGDAAMQTWSAKEFTLRVPPAAGTQPADRPTTLVLFDDLGRGSDDDAYTWNHYGEPAFNTSRRVGALVQAGLVDAIYHGGDVSYAVGYEAVWDFFMDMISPMASGALYLTTVGNHEIDWYNTSTTGTFYSGTDSGGECGVFALKMLPQPAPATIKAPWWSYDVGLVHLVGMSTEHDYLAGGVQWTWLENDLKTVDRTKTPFIIFGGHRAMYLNSDYGGSWPSDIVTMQTLIDNVEPLLLRYKVNLCFYGHNHVMQRQAAVYQQKVVQLSSPETIDGETVHVHRNPQAPVHMVIGSGGAKLSRNAVYPQPAWNELVLNEWGFAVVKAHNASYLEWAWTDCQDGQVKDRMVITQDAQALSQPWPCPAGATCLPEAQSAGSSSSDGEGHASQRAVIIGCSVAAALLFVVSAALWRFYSLHSKKQRQSPGSASPSFDSVTDPIPARSTSAFQVSATVSPLQGLVIPDDPGSPQRRLNPEVQI